jgi:hypothetical protein
MALHRFRKRHPGSMMYRHRKGGAVTLFNYNPSIVGGGVGHLRFHTKHRRGLIRHHKRHATSAAILQTAGPASAHSLHAGGATGLVSHHRSAADGRKRILEAISHHFSSKRR